MPCRGVRWTLPRVGDIPPTGRAPEAIIVSRPLASGALMGEDRYPLDAGTEAIGLSEFMEEVISG